LPDINIITRGQAFQVKYKESDVLIVFNNAMDNGFMQDFKKNPLIKNDILNKIRILEITADDVEPTFFNEIWYFLFRYSVYFPRIFNIVNKLYNFRKSLRHKLFDLNSGRKLIRFAERHHYSTFYIACEYGKGRSVTTGFFLNKYLLKNHSPSEFLSVKNTFIFKCLEYLYLRKKY
jgi:hypothetical protein